ncbi:hypothetical protein [Deinococcus misasensis]|uniref:hypothetical protein n=1 Tax=Deinococcus misasensis TaxID=392413 RepID=UPI000A467792|nr:hypothetical protein [Deinococcus misasensis]
MTVLLTLGGVAVLGGVGFVAFRVMQKPAAPVATSPATSGNAPGSASNPIMVANPGLPLTSNGYTLSDKPADIQADILRKIQEQNERDALQRKNDKIFELKQQLNQAQNELKRLIDQANNIDQLSVPQELVEAIKARHVSDCQGNTTWILRPACDSKRDLSEGYDKVLEDEWRKRKAEMKRPILTRMSELDALQLNLIGNLKALGVDVPKINPLPDGAASPGTVSGVPVTGGIFDIIRGITGGRPPVYPI